MNKLALAAMIPKLSSGFEERSFFYKFTENNLKVNYYKTNI